jgi:hypothetical protein
MGKKLSSYLMNSIGLSHIFQFSYEGFQIVTGYQYFFTQFKNYDLQLAWIDPYMSI